MTRLYHLIKHVLEGEDGAYSLWLASNGNKDLAVKITKDLIRHFLLNKELADSADFIPAFDSVLAELAGDGCEIEWNS